MVVEWVTYKNKRILVGHIEGLAEAECLAAIDEIKREILKHRAHPRSVLFMNCTTSNMSERLTEKWKEFNRDTKDTVKACAIVGLNFFTRSFARLLNRELYFASDEKDASEWLARQ
jgi:hypothetical protein